MPIWKKEHYRKATPAGSTASAALEPSAHAHAHDHAHPEPLELEFPSLTAARAAGYELVDVREQWERDADPPGLRITRHLPLSEYMNGRSRLDDLNDGGRYLIVCAHGVRSLALTEELRAHGHAAVYSLRGGLAALRA